MIDPGFKDKVALITGGNNPLGIGAAIARALDIANTVVFFTSEQAAWITGQLLFVHGGHRMALGR